MPSGQSLTRDVDDEPSQRCEGPNTEAEHPAEERRLGLSQVPLKLQAECRDLLPQLSQQLP